MRGLDIRVMLAQARIAAVYDAVQADEMHYDVRYEAMAQGMRDARDGIHHVPILFNGEKLLISSWYDGFESELERMEMDDCPECNDGTGNPCSVHG
ncbi:MAG: hypothetical protein V4724_18855 [Pseudomonadota bacterium]